MQLIAFVVITALMFNKKSAESGVIIQLMAILCLTATDHDSCRKSMTSLLKYIVLKWS